MPQIPKRQPPYCPEPEPYCPINPWAQCVLNKPLLLYIPPGQHVHMACPAHPGGHVIYGNNITWNAPAAQPSPTINVIGQYIPSTTTWDIQSPPPWENINKVMC